MKESVKDSVTEVKESVSEVTSEKEKDEDVTDAYNVAREHLSNGRSECLLGEQPDHRIRATAIVENNKLGPGETR